MNTFTIRHDDAGRVICNDGGDELMLNVYALQLYGTIRDKRRDDPERAATLEKIHAIREAIHASEKRRGLERPHNARYISYIQKRGASWYEIGGTIGTRSYIGYSKRDAVTRYNREARGL